MAKKYDVFISFKNTDPKGGLTVDRTIAQRMHDKLLDEGLNVFFSEKDLSDTEFMNQIYTALDEADLLIVAGTNPEYVRSTWVKSEWMNFLGAINSGRKPNGKIMTVLSHMTTHDLPLELSNFQSFDASSLDDAVAYAFRTLGKISNSQAREWEKAENERKLRKAEEERLKMVKAQMEAEQREKEEREKLEQANRKTEEEKKKRLAAEEKANQATGFSKKDGFLAIIGVVLLALAGGAYAFKRYDPVISIAAGVGMLLIGTVTKVLLFAFLKWKYKRHARGEVTIIRYRGRKKNIIVPTVLNGKTVTRIGECAFYHKRNLISVTIPDGVKSIEDNAFRECSNLTLIAIPNSVTSIGNHAFASCISLTTITIPDSVTSIDSCAFSKCSSLTTVTIPDGVTKISNGAFDGCSSLTSITISNKVTSIGWNAFNNCRTLTSITIPNGVTFIGEWAFARCRSLASVTIPDSVTSIGNEAFLLCQSLTSVTIPDGVKTMGANPFRSCENLKNINVSYRNTHFCSVDGVLFSKDMKTIYAYPESKGGSKYIIPSSVTSIGDSAFNNCMTLTSIMIPDGVTSIGKSAFAGCKSLTSIKIPNNVSFIGRCAFSDCRSLTSVIIGSGLTSIGDYAFEVCSSLTVYAPHEADYYGSNLGNYRKWVVQ